MAIDPTLLEILVCPVDKGPLHLLESESCFYNPRLRRRYEIRDDIPVMLVEESTEVTDDTEHERLLTLADDPPAMTGPSGPET